MLSNFIISFTIDKASGIIWGGKIYWEGFPQRCQNLTGGYNDGDVDYYAPQEKYWETSFVQNK